MALPKNYSDTSPRYCATNVEYYQENGGMLQYVVSEFETYKEAEAFAKSNPKITHILYTVESQGWKYYRLAVADQTGDVLVEGMSWEDTILALRDLHPILLDASAKCTKDYQDPRLPGLRESYQKLCRIRHDIMARRLKRDQLLRENLDEQSLQSLPTPRLRG